MRRRVVVYLAAYGLVKALKEDKDSLFVLTYAIYAGVGIGSVLFHATLKYTMQMGRSPPPNIFPAADIDM